MNILVAEDAAVNAILLRNILEREGHRVVVVKNGVEALEALQEHPEIDLLAADIRMPEMDGIMLVRELRSRPDTQDLPVLFITGVADAATVREAVELKIAGYILKPITEPSRVVAKLRAIAENSGVVLESEDDTRQKLGLDVSTYREMLGALGELVREAMANGAGDDLIPQLRDSAGSVGADRLMRALGDEVGNPPDQTVLVRELKALATELEIRGFGAPEPSATG